MDAALLKPILEAALLAAGQPLTIAQLSELFDEDSRPTHTELAQALESLAGDCEGRGVELVEVASGFRYQVRSSVHAHVARLWTERQSKYSRALLETLALIAYRQPITRGEIEAVRGVAVSTQIIKTLEEREWIRSVGHRDVPGRGLQRGHLGSARGARLRRCAQARQPRLRSPGHVRDHHVAIAPPRGAARRH